MNFEFFFTRFHSTSQNAIKSDIKLLSTGYALLIFYVAFVIGKLNRLEVKVFPLIVKVRSHGLLRDSPGK